MNKLSITLLALALLLTGTVLFATPMPAFQQTGAVQENAQTYDGSETDEAAPNYFIKGAIFTVGLLMFWVLFYYLIYPSLLKYYSPGYSKKLFWSLILLYSISWICLGAYVLFEVGFYIEWLKYVFAVIGALWLIWFITIMASKDRAYY
ncbi:MAG: hypothetical protein GY765_09100 [bacterium]|nr:hypothetical protein [bacterium]